MPASTASGRDTTQYNVRLSNVNRNVRCDRDQGPISVRHRTAKVEPLLDVGRDRRLLQGSFMASATDMEVDVASICRRRFDAWPIDTRSAASELLKGRRGPGRALVSRVVWIEKRSETNHHVPNGERSQRKSLRGHTPKAPRFPASASISGRP